MQTPENTQTPETEVEACPGSDKESSGSPQQTNPEIQGTQNINPPGTTTPPEQGSGDYNNQGYQPPPGYQTFQGYAMPAQSMGPQPQQAQPQAFQPPPVYTAPQEYPMHAQPMGPQPQQAPPQAFQPPPVYGAPQGYPMHSQPMGPQPQQAPQQTYQPPPAYGSPQGYPMSMPGQPEQPENGHSCNCHGNAETSDLKHDQNRYGQLLDAVTGIINGEPDMNKIAGVLDSYDASFWKGAIIGVAASLVLTNDTVKGAITGTISKATGKTE